MGINQTTDRDAGVVQTITNSWLLMLGVFGVVFVLLGMVLQTGVVAGLLPVYGFVFILIGVGGYLLIQLMKRL